MREILRRMVTETTSDMRERICDWEYRWKGVSHEGFDVIRNNEIDYGNAEYHVVLGAIGLLDDGYYKGFILGRASMLL